MVGSMVSACDGVRGRAVRQAGHPHRGSAPGGPHSLQTLWQGTHFATSSVTPYIHTSETHVEAIPPRAAAARVGGVRGRGAGVGDRAGVPPGGVGKSVPHPADVAWRYAHPRLCDGIPSLRSCSSRGTPHARRGDNP